MSDATFARPDLATFCRLDELGLEVVGQQLEPGRALLACRVREPDRWCRRCGCEGAPRATVTRRLAHEPFGWRPTILLVTLCRYRCSGCGHVWRQDLSKAAEPRAKLTRGGMRWALMAIVCQHLTVARVAEALGVAWNTANDAVLAEGQRVMIADPARFAAVKVLGVDEHVWRHTRTGDKYATVIMDLTGIRDGTGPARLLDMVQGRSKQAFKTWLADRPKVWRDAVEVVAMDGFTGLKTATSARLRPSTADSSTDAAAPWAFATSPSTWPDRSSRPAASGRSYTLLCEEPDVAAALRPVGVVVHNSNVLHFTTAGQGQPLQHSGVYPRRTWDARSWCGLQSCSPPRRAVSWRWLMSLGEHAGAGACTARPPAFVACATRREEGGPESQHRSKERLEVVVDGPP